MSQKQKEVCFHCGNKGYDDGTSFTLVGKWVVCNQCENKFPFQKKERSIRKLMFQENSFNIKRREKILRMLKK